jgi:hypothetical protein
MAQIKFLGPMTGNMHAIDPSQRRHLLPAERNRMSAARMKRTAGRPPLNRNLALDWLSLGNALRIGLRYCV